MSRGSTKGEQIVTGNGMLSHPRESPVHSRARDYGDFGDIRGSLTYQQPLLNLAHQFAARRFQVGVRLNF